MPYKKHVIQSLRMIPPMVLHKFPNLLLLSILILGQSQGQDLVVVQLADGGTSRPYVLQPLYEDDNVAIPDSSALGSPQYNNDPVPSESITAPHEKRTEKRTPQNSDDTSEAKIQTAVTSYTATTPLSSTTTTTTTTISRSTTRTSANPSTSTTLTTKHHQPTTSSSTVLPTTEPTISPSDCHQSCHAALNSTHLHPHTSLTLAQGSQLTLLCEVPLFTSLVLQNLVWLYESDNMSPGQCALNTQEFISSCQGFQTITHINDRNDTYIKDTIKVGNLQANYSGQYICQVEITCCPHTSEEHVMTHQLSSRVTVWLTDYTIDLAIMGSLAVGLLLILLVGSIYLARQKHGDYVAITDKTCDVKPTTVLHIPLVDDQDNDSFDSNFDEHE